MCFKPPQRHRVSANCTISTASYVASDSSWLRSKAQLWQQFSAWAPSSNIFKNNKSFQVWNTKEETGFEAKKRKFVFIPTIPTNRVSDTPWHGFVWIWILLKTLDQRVSIETCCWGQRSALWHVELWILMTWDHESRIRRRRKSYFRESDGI